MSKQLLPTNDYIFKRIFGKKGNEDITRNFIKATTGYDFENITIEDTQILEKDVITDKLGILDVKVSANGTSDIDIEMQVVRQDSIIERILWYWSKLYSSTIKSGQEYDLLKRTICILIADFNIERLKEIDSFYTRWNLRENKHNYFLLTDKLDIVIIELSKMETSKIENIEEKELLNWCNFLKAPEKMEESIMEENKYIRAAKDELDKINMDERERRLAELRDKAIRDEKAIRKSGYREGIEREKLNIAKKLIEEHVDVEIISRTTGLSTEDIQRIENEDKD